MSVISLHRNQLTDININHFTGQESKPFTETDSDSGKGTMTSYGSTNSINSNGSSQLPSQPLDNPEQFENLKQQKEIMEHGIEL